MGRRAFRRNDVIDQQSRSQTEPIPAATRNVHLDNATSGATFTRTVQPSPGQDPDAPCSNLTCKCLVHLKIARDAPRLLGFAIYVWTIPAQVVQIYIAISASAASGRVERLQRAEPGPSSGVYRPHRSSGRMAGACECVAPGGDHAATGARSWQVSSFGCGGSGCRRARTRTRRAGSHPPRSPTPASARTTPGSGPHRARLEGGVAHFGSKKCPQRPPRLCEALQNH